MECLSQGCSKKKLSLQASQWLSREVRNEEIKVALFHMNLDKAPGLDGYNAFFFQKNRHIVWDDTCAAAKHFFNKGRMLSEVNNTFVTLVPKTANASQLSDFRPILCCNTIYKVISNVLATRLQQVIGELISPNQTAFLKGRRISDASLLAHEHVRDFNNPWEGGCALK